MGGAVDEPFVDGRVMRVAAYGLYLDTAAGPALVLLPDVSATPIDLAGAFAPGQAVRVRLLRYIAAYGLHKGTMIADPPTEGPR